MSELFLRLLPVVVVVVLLPVETVLLPVEVVLVPVETVLLPVETVLLPVEVVLLPVEAVFLVVEEVVFLVVDFLVEVVLVLSLLTFSFFLSMPNSPNSQSRMVEPTFRSMPACVVGMPVFLVNLRFSAGSPYCWLRYHQRSFFVFFAMVFLCFCLVQCVF